MSGRVPTPTAKYSEDTDRAQHPKARPLGSRIRLLATDLDGTLIGSVSDFPLYTVFRERLEDLRRAHGTLWAACTGRSFKSFWAFFSPMRTMGLTPDFVVIRHAYIYGRTRWGYVPHVFWNVHIRYHRWRESLYVHDALDEWEARLTGGALGVASAYRHGSRLCLTFRSDEAAATAADLLAQWMEPFRHLRLFRYRREVDIREVPHTKGLAVAELAARLGIRRDEVLAIGNGTNDISMLDGAVAVLTGCPANSEPEVTQTVHRSGGHIASQRALAGVLEILEAVTEGKIHSELPPFWQPPEEGPNPMAKSIPPRRPLRPVRGRTRSFRRRTPWILAGSMYAVLTAFAAFDLIPWGWLVLKPVAWMSRLFEWILRLFYAAT